MKLFDFKKHPREELFKKLKKVTLLNSEKTGKPIFVYRNTSIDLREAKIKDLLPVQLYQLRSSNQLILNLFKIFQKKHKEDIFNMNGYFTYKSENKRYAFIPPVVECITGPKGETQRIIIDGLHRILLAKELKEEAITVVLISGIPQELILPVAPNAWQEIKVAKTAPENENKRKWLISPEKGYLYYRNFQSVFQNVGQPKISALTTAPQQCKVNYGAAKDNLFLRTDF